MRVDAKDSWCAAMKCPTAKIAVFLGDVLLDHCVAADTEEGWADVWVLDARGNPKVVDGQFVTERRHGRVELKRWADNAKRGGRR